MNKSRIIFVFCVLLVGLYFVTNGFLGENGFFYNKTLEKMLIQREYQEDKISIELDSLIERQLQLASDQGLKDAALSLGYYTEGDKVYLFSSSSKQDAVYAGNTWDTDIKLFNPLNKFLCFVISLVVSGLISFSYAFILFIKHRDYSTDDEDLSDNNESEFGGNDYDDFRV